VNEIINTFIGINGVNVSEECYKMVSDKEFRFNCIRAKRECWDTEGGLSSGGTGGDRPSQFFPFSYFIFCLFTLVRIPSCGEFPSFPRLTIGFRLGVSRRNSAFSFVLLFRPRKLKDAAWL
jgi:hypothetical protein